MNEKFLILFVISVLFAKIALCNNKFVDIVRQSMVPNEEEVCLQQLDLLVKNIQNPNISDPWGLQMIDSWSKIPSGYLFSGNWGDAGNFEECLNINSIVDDLNVKGKYCYGFINVKVQNASRTNYLDRILVERKAKLQRSLDMLSEIPTAIYTELPNSYGPPIALCLPSRCSQNAFQGISDSFFQAMPVSVNYLCQSQEDIPTELKPGVIWTLVFFSIITALMVASTIYDYYSQQNKKEAIKILLAFSVYTNGSKLFTVSHNPTQLECLDGIRVLSMMWVVAAHTASTNRLGLVSNALYVSEFADSIYSMIFVSGTLAVDTFLIIGGLLVVYIYFKSVHNNVKFNLLIFYIHRYLRLTPAMAAVILVSATSLEYFGSGPLWPFVVIAFQGFCVDKWWLALLFVQNYVTTEQLCLGQSWYLDIDMQLYFFSPIFLLALKKFKSLGVWLMGFMVIVFIAVPFWSTWSQEVAALPSDFYHGATYNTKYYLLTHNRAAPWFIGGIAGYYIAKIKFDGLKIKLSRVANIAIWSIITALFLTCIFAGHSTLRGKEYNKWGSAFYNAMVRPVWSICVVWVIFACVNGFGGPVQRLLSLPIFQILNRFLYSVYLLHVTILYMMLYARKSGKYFSILNACYEFWGIFIFTLGLSLYWVLAFESPVVILEGMLLKFLRRSKK